MKLQVHRINLIEQEVYTTNKRVQIIQNGRYLQSAEQTPRSYNAQGLRSGAQTPRIPLGSEYQKPPSLGGQSQYGQATQFNSQSRMQSRPPSRHEYMNNSLQPGVFMQSRRSVMENIAGSQKKQQTFSKPQMIDLLEDERIGKRREMMEDIENIDDDSHLLRKSKRR